MGSEMCIRDSRYVWGWRGLFILLVMVTVLNGLLSPAFSLMPLLVTEHFGRGALELSWLNSAAGVGVICLLYTSDAADELDGVDLGGRRIIKKKKR